MILFRNFIFTALSNQKLKYPKDSAKTLNGDTFQTFYATKTLNGSKVVPHTEYSIEILCKDSFEYVRFNQFLDNNATNIWGISLPYINEVTVLRQKSAVEISRYFIATISQNPSYQITDTDGNASIRDGFLSFNSSTFVKVARYIPCVLTSDIEVEWIEQSTTAAMKINFTMIEVMQ